MNTLPLLFLFSALALQADVSQPLGADEALLINLRPYGLEPIAVRQADGNFREVPLTGPEAIVERFFIPGTLYPAWLHGQKQGEFRVEAYHPPGCSGFGLVSAPFSGPANPSQPSYLGFSSGYPGTRSLTAAPPLTPQLLHDGVTLSQQFYRREGLTAAQLKRMKLEQVTPLKLEGQLHLLVTSRIKRGADTPHSCHTHHLTLLAEQTAAGWTPRLELLKSDTQQEGECSGYTPLGIFDNGTGTPHLALEGHGYEWNWYEIYRQAPDHSWQNIFNGGGGGC
ncbi:MAG: hypothetical protein ACO1RX_03840 [Candidatus Sericytochromatia bacterium]